MNVPGIHPIKQTLLNFGEPPINVGARIARRLGLEFYAIIKPYEAGHSTSETIGQSAPSRNYRPSQDWRSLRSYLSLDSPASGNCGCAPGKVTFPGAWMGLSFRSYPASGSWTIQPTLCVERLLKSGPAPTTTNTERGTSVCGQGECRNLPSKCFRYQWQARHRQRSKGKSPDASGAETERSLHRHHD